jgi:N-acetylneuraminic acid mutarotase
MAYDAERKRTVLYGGSGKDNDYDDTWEFDGISWQKVDAPVNPGRRGHHVMVYDPSRKKVLLYGGEIGMEVQGDVWAWDGKLWERLSTNGPARFLPAITFNTDNNKLYVFGGNGGDHGMLIYSDLWEWDGQNWKQADRGKVYEWNNSKDMYVPAAIR